MKRWLLLSGGVVAGLIVGYIIGSLISVNVFDFSYEASFNDLWRDDPAAVWVVVVTATPGATAGGVLAWTRTNH